MKFGRYLQDHLTPEWKRAYIDYRACKKAIKVVNRRLEQRDAQEGEGQEDAEDGKDSSDIDDDDHGPSRPLHKTPSMHGSGSLRSSRQGGSASIRTLGTPGTALSKVDSRRHDSRIGSSTLSPRSIKRHPSPPPPLDLGESSYPKHSDAPAPETSRSGRGFKRSATISEAPAEIIQGQQHESSPDEADAEGDGGDDPGVSDSGRVLTSPGVFKVKSAFSPKLTKSPRFFKSPRMGTDQPKSSGLTKASPSLGRRSIRSLTLPSPRTPSMPVRHAETFEDLYENLEDDEKAFFDLLDKELDKVEQFYLARELEAVARAAELQNQLTQLGEHRRAYHQAQPGGFAATLLPPQQAINLTKAADKLRLRVPFVHDTDTETQGATANGIPAASRHNSEHPTTGNENGGGNDSGRSGATSPHEFRSFNPERYQQYKRELRTAILEFYRHLERIKNYRILNLTGFRKALKKFEKVTKIHCLDLYTDERISKQSFAGGEVIEKLIDQMEDLYSEHFEHGDSKKARDKLRRLSDVTTHYNSVFRAGICIGLGVPAAIFAIVQALEQDTRQAIPAIDGLLQVYGALFLPVIFGMLFELNLNAFVEARINYEFVMELVKPTLDHRSFLEIPAFLFMTLSYCFFFSMYRVGASNVAPTTWPLVWIVFLVVFFLNPLDVFRRSSRYWFLRVLFRVITPGYSRVEFIAFFVADEMNSLAWSLENIYFMGCCYSKHWPSDIFNHCPVGRRWPYALILSLPALSRLIQCLKRYHDSKIGVHLINAGKYLSVIVQYIIFVLWRSRGSEYHDPVFIVWVPIAAIYSTYTSAWDLIVDWSLFRPNSALLRKDRGYSSRYVYYFAMVTNVIVRWEWICYLPDPHNRIRLRVFFLAVAEMLRRWQWNFFRVETEHLGNADAYRVTREIPLPYRRVEVDSEDEDAAPVGAGGPRKPEGPIRIRLNRFKRELLGDGKTGQGQGQSQKDPTKDGTRDQVTHSHRDYEAGRTLNSVPSRSGDESEV